MKNKTPSPHEILLFTRLNTPNGGGHTGADGGWWLRCLDRSARIERANGGASGLNRSSAFLVGFELDLMAAIAYEASGSTRQALRRHEVADSVSTSLAPRSQPTTTRSKHYLLTVGRSARRQQAWHGSLPPLIVHVNCAGPGRFCSRMSSTPPIRTIRGSPGSSRAAARTTYIGSNLRSDV